MRRVLILLAVAALAGAAPVLARSTSGGAQPDPTFGNGRGFVTTSIDGQALVGYASVAIPGGDVVIAGQVFDANGNGQILVARYLPSGKLDPSFGSHGMFRSSLPVADGPFIATAIVPQGSSLLIGGGYGQASMLALRLTRAGRLDRTFGAHHNGVATIVVGGIAQSIALQRNGGILLGGSNANVNGRPMVVARLTRNGQLDRRFGKAGIAQVLFWNANQAASAGATGLTAAPNGGVIASGHLDYIGTDGHGSAGLFRLSASGQLVSGFGTGGHVEVAFTNASGRFAQWFPCALTLDGSGRLTVTGDGALPGAGAQLLSARLTSRGALDHSFGTGGRAVTGGLSDDNSTTCGAYASSGSLTVGVGPTIIRLKPTGASDSSFARGGVLTVRVPANVTVNAAVPSPGAGKFLVAGSAGDNVYVARFLAQS